MNRNTLWANIFVDELARSGLKAVCAAPGSRHTPLMLAFAKHPDIKVYSHLDERSASFFALGLALATDEPVALICSSGTAGANMYPAIIEAHQSRVPLIVITADRPHELRHSGANQTIDQIKMFGGFVLWFVDMALPEANPPAIAIRNLRTIANRAYAKANGLRKGVVHINMPFRKPLEPTEVEGDMVDVPEEASPREKIHGQRPMFTWMTYPDLMPTNMHPLGILRHVFIHNPNGVILCGGNLTLQDAKAITQLGHHTGYPVLAETYSQARHEHRNLGGYDFYTKFLQAPNVIVRFGDTPISNQLNTFISTSQAEFFIQISSDGVWTDDSHLVSHFIQCSVSDFTERIEEITSGIRFDSALSTQYTALENSTWQTIDHEIATGQYFDGAVVYDVVDLIPDESTLFAGNSLPVRHLDQFGRPTNKRIYAYANRGASGIDGNVSTALGTGAARPDKPLVAILGDITFYHDMNGLLAVHRCGVPITIVLINNNGGGIFNRLPIRDFEPEFTEYFLTPHGLDFSHAAKLYGLDYLQIDAYSEGAREAFRQAFSEKVASGKSTIIEVRTDSRRDEARRQEIVAAVHEKLKELDL